MISFSDQRGQMITFIDRFDGIVILVCFQRIFTRARRQPQNQEFEEPRGVQRAERKDNAYCSADLRI
jgi:hypothetical protein